MVWRLAYSLETLRNQVNEAYPNRSMASDGTIGDVAHQAVPSDHNPNAAGVVCALDLTNSPDTGFDAHALADRLREQRHPDLKYLISNRRIAGDWTNWNWTPYSGTSDPHINHIHISVGTGPDGQSTQPYDDRNNWNVKGEIMEPADYKTNEGDVVNFYQQMLGRKPHQDEINTYVNKPWKEVTEAFWASDEYKNRLNAGFVPVTEQLFKKG